MMLLPWGWPFIKQFLSNIFIPQYLSPVVEYKPFFNDYGYLPIILFLLGAFYLTTRSEIRAYSVVCGALLLQLVLVVYYIFHFGVGNLYERLLLHARLFIGILAGAGLAAVKNFRPGWDIGRLKLHLWVKYASMAACLGLAAMVLVSVIPLRQKANLYHMIDKNDYEAFTWIKDNVGSSYDKAILDPWKGTAFTAITGKMVFSRITMAASGQDNQAYAFLDNAARETTLLRSNNVSIVYSTKAVDNPNLVKVRENVYLLKGDGITQ